jgi:hypothetical protein
MRITETMSNARSARLAPIVVLGLLLLAGCGGSDEDLAPVEGTVTLDGQPLAGAKVEFDLDPGAVRYGKMAGSSAYGKTDASGRFKLKSTHERSGAPVGKNIVRISTRDMTVDSSGKEVLVPERLPPRYNTTSVLSEEVQPGSNKFQFDLTLESPPAGKE